MNAPDGLHCAAFLLSAFIPAGCLHTAWLKSSWSLRLAIPLDFGLKLRGRHIFGANKMVRGFVMIVPAGGISFLLLSALFQGPWILSPLQYGGLGAVAGLGFMLGELPNSFIKRQLDILPGASPIGMPAKSVCFLIDRTDSILGMLIAIRFFVPLPWLAWIVVLGAGACIHASFSIVMYRLAIKARPF